MLPPWRPTEPGRIGGDPFCPLIDQVNRGIQWLKGTEMQAAYDSLLERITIDSDVRFGKPCIRGHRITVQEILEWLSSGASQQQILADYPQLEPDDFLAVYAYAAELAGRKVSKG
jgi:uncharacterized protein (DUF433 family)